MSRERAVTIHRAKPTENYTIVRNAILDDRALSLEALGLLIYLLGRPADWSVSVTHLKTEHKIGRDKVLRLIKQLQDAGYITRHLVRNSDTKAYQQTQYHVFDTPKGTKEPRPENTDVDRDQNENIEAEGATTVFAGSGKAGDGKAGSGKQGRILRTDSYKEQKDTNPPYTPQGVGRVDAPLDLVWIDFQERWQLSATDSFELCRVHWQKLTPDEQLLALRYAKGYQAASRNQTRPTNVRNYLAGKRWQGQQQKAKKLGVEVRKQVFVYEGTEAWKAWLKFRGKGIPKTGDKKTGAQGWYFDSLFPPVAKQQTEGARANG
ncbi:MAG: hypothetical protein JKY96_01510 [Phycisphaerales bacterium]|nr:hypothetical protein [Phycisphaerales bacterium]